MRITTCGASGGEVTGSCYLIETSRARVLLDCGVFQGGGSKDDAKNLDLGPVEPATLTAAILSHAHLDHCGRFPLLAARGLSCPIYATPATVDFATVVLEDSVKIQEADAARENRYRQREGKPLVEPLYTREDGAALLPLIREVPYGKAREIAQGITITFTDAGHILGSASVRVNISDQGVTKTVVFSADVGRWDTPFLADPVAPRPGADVIFLESTYGDRDHAGMAETQAQFEKIVQEAIWAKEKILIPAFAIGRTQHVLYHLAAMMRKGGVPEVPIFLDSPMAIKATELYKKHQGLFDAEARAHAAKRGFSADLRNLQYTTTGEESRALNDVEGCCIIIAGGGMCEGGRIVHHLRHNLWKHGVTVMMVGYSGRGTLGRELIEGATEVSIHRRMIPVRAKIQTLGGFSAHAGQSELIRWIKPALPRSGASPRIYLTHGENPPRLALAAKLKETCDVEAILPELYDVIEL